MNDLQNNSESLASQDDAQTSSMSLHAASADVQNGSVLSPDQQEAYRLINMWLLNPKTPHFYLGGYAGTGKSTLVRYILDNLPAHMAGRAVVMTPTGKAADVLRKKGIPEACTVHSAIYSPISPMQQRIDDLRQMLKTPLMFTEGERRAIENELGELVGKGPSFSASGRDFIKEMKLLICDEFSMVGTDLYNDIIAQGIPLLAVGDPGQLPPVKDSKPPFAPDYVLEKIHRQAEGNPIIKLAHQARHHGGFVPFGSYGESKVIGEDEYTRDMLLSHDQIICFTHVCRRAVNKKVRDVLGHTEHKYPVSGEKLVCKKNDPELRVWNGGMYSSASRAQFAGGMLSCNINNGIGILENVPLLPTIFDEYHRVVRDHERLSYDERRGIAEFDYGYVITGHAAQGSEWDSVLVIDETHKMRGDQQKAEWMYTAITRAAKRVTIYKPWSS